MSKMIPKKHRQKNAEILHNFLINCDSLDIVVNEKELGSAIFLNVPYEMKDIEYNDEKHYELKIFWKNAEAIEGDIQIAGLPTTPFLTQYTVFRKNGDYLCLNTGGGYRYCIYIQMFKSDSDKSHKCKVEKVLSEYREAIIH